MRQVQTGVKQENPLFLQIARHIGHTLQAVQLQQDDRLARQKHVLDFFQPAVRHGKLFGPAASVTDLIASQLQESVQAQ